MEPPVPSWLEKAAVSVVDRIPNVFRHPISGLIVGALIVFSGHNEIQWRSVGLIIVALWLAVDLGAWLLHKRTDWKFVIGWTATSVLFILGMNFMLWELQAQLQDQRDNVSLHLTANHYLPFGAEDDPMHSMFSVSNNSQYALSRRHQIVCITNLAVGNDGTGISGNNASGIVNGHMTIGNIPHVLSDTRLEPGGDAQTEPCLAYLKFKNTDCVDMELRFWYSLEHPARGSTRKEVSFCGLQEQEWRLFLVPGTHRFAA